MEGYPRVGDVMKTIQVLDLFCGAGGFTLGAVLAGRRCGVGVETFGVDKWGPAVATSRRAGHRASRRTLTTLGRGSPSVLMTLTS